MLNLSGIIEHLGQMADDFMGYGDDEYALGIRAAAEEIKKEAGRMGDRGAEDEAGGEVLGQFTVHGRLPSLNEYVNACRSHWSKGAKMVKSCEELIDYDILAARSKGEIKSVDCPVEVSFCWCEKSRRRDFDNIIFAQKFILDVLQIMGILPGDGRKFVRGIRHGIIDGTEDAVTVTLLKSTEGHVGGFAK